MCIIVYKKAGVEMPSLETLNNCFQNNSDGCGIAIRTKSKIKFVKGLMTFEDVKRVYEEIKNLKDAEVCIHFRLTSAGLTIPEQTHPFPVGIQNALEGEADSVIFHNGTILNLAHDPQKSDTQILSEILSDIPYHKIPDTLQLASGKFVYMGQEGTHIIGEFVEENGILYSNHGYKDIFLKNVCGIFLNTAKEKRRNKREKSKKKEQQKKKAKQNKVLLEVYKNTQKHISILRKDINKLEKENKCLMKSPFDTAYNEQYVLERINEYLSEAKSMIVKAQNFISDLTE